MVMGHTNLATVPVRMVTHPSTNQASDCLTLMINHEVLTPSYQVAPVIDICRLIQVHTYIHTYIHLLAQICTIKDWPWAYSDMLEYHRDENPPQLHQRSRCLDLEYVSITFILKFNSGIIKICVHTKVSFQGHHFKSYCIIQTNRH